MAAASHNNNNEWSRFPVHAVTSDNLVTSPDFFTKAEAIAASGQAAINLKCIITGLTCPSENESRD